MSPVAPAKTQTPYTEIERVHVWYYSVFSIYILQEVKSIGACPAFTQAEQSTEYSGQGEGDVRHREDMSGKHSGSPISANFASSLPG